MQHHAPCRMAVQHAAMDDVRDGMELLAAALLLALAFRRIKIVAPLPCDPCFPREPRSSGGPVFMAGEIANVASKVAESIAKRMSLPGLP